MTIDLNAQEQLATRLSEVAQQCAECGMQETAQDIVLSRWAILALIAEVRALREDKARLDWLQSFVDKEGRASISRIGGAYGIFNSESVASGFSMHEAIDAARKG